MFVFWPWLPCWGARSQTEQYSRTIMGPETQRPTAGWMHSNTSITPHRPVVARGQSSKKWTGTFPLTWTPSGQRAGSALRVSQLIANTFSLGQASHKHQHSAGELRLTTGFYRDQQLRGALPEVLPCIRKKLQPHFLVSDSWKTASLFTIFCCFSWHWKKVSP